jgi:glutaconyl-CoA/methylmalonyl-CoA decarboxylase subunit gamma
LKLHIKIDGKTYEAEVDIVEEEASQPAFAPYTPAPAPVQAVPAQTSTGSANEKQYGSPVNGLVIRIGVAPGKQVEPGETLIVLEAMKMENNVIARHAGKVKCVNVAPGDPVKLHQILIEME